MNKIWSRNSNARWDHIKIIRFVKEGEVRLDVWV